MRKFLTTVLLLIVAMYISAQIGLHERIVTVKPMCTSENIEIPDAESGQLISASAELKDDCVKSNYTPGGVDDFLLKNEDDISQKKNKTALKKQVDSFAKAVGKDYRQVMPYISSDYVSQISVSDFNDLVNTISDKARTDVDNLLKDGYPSEIWEKSDTTVFDGRCERKSGAAVCCCDDDARRKIYTQRMDF
ncbi:hypothetical protein [Dysgonomonas sp. 520]|uniref:hypothetical protein n=1 Tax=Dysgonomonas sp. 520 TaxID=2302931 RepID=UPI0013D6D641|nr:hypothetical protein [Dysgonomonas sp. 520]